MKSWSCCQEDEWPWSQCLICSFDHWFPIEIRGPVHQVEGPKQHREHYPGHLVNLAHAVVSLFGVWSLGFRGFELHSSAVWNGRDGRVLCEVGCIIHTGRTGVVWLFRQSQWILLLWKRKKCIDFELQFLTKTYTRENLFSCFGYTGFRSAVNQGFILVGKILPVGKQYSKTYRELI